MSFFINNNLIHTIDLSDGPLSNVAYSVRILYIPEQSGTRSSCCTQKSVPVLKTGRKIASRKVSIIFCLALLS
jgi:hypothetical protein